METNVIIIRLILIVILSFLIGLEREFRHQPAGIRTHILIGLGSTLLMIISIMMPRLYESAVGDPGRIAAQVVTGVGFLGAGVIMRMGFSTKGLTTAANVWVTSAIGLAIGAGMYELGIIATILILFNLVIIAKVKKKYIEQAHFCNIKIDIKKNKQSLHKLISTIENLPIRIISKDIKESGLKITLGVVADLNKQINTYQLHEILRTNIKIENISITENIR